MRKRTVIWLAIVLSGVLAYYVMLVESAPPLVRLACALYALIVVLGLFAVVGVTLSVKFGRLDSANGFLARIFLPW
jgi:hypothetical protein